jgi:hypothetical protein
MDTHRNPTAGYQPGPQTGDHLAAAAGSHAEVGRLLAHLEQRLEELDRLHREIAEDAHALAHAAAATAEGRDGARAGSVYSIRAAATELGVSVSMLHKLLKQRRLGHLKVGARTLITAVHLEQFREASQVRTPEVRTPEVRTPEVRTPETSPERAASGGWRSVVDVELAVAEYVDWCNYRRLHGEIGQLPPAEFEANHWASITPEHYPQKPVSTGLDPTNRVSVKPGAIQSR